MPTWPSPSKKTRSPGCELVARDRDAVSRTAHRTSAAARRRPARTPTSRGPSSRSRRARSRPTRTACRAARARCRRRRCASAAARRPCPPPARSPRRRRPCPAAAAARRWCWATMRACAIRAICSCRACSACTICAIWPLIEESSRCCSPIFDSIDCFAAARSATRLLLRARAARERCAVSLHRSPERPSPAPATRASSAVTLFALSMRLIMSSRLLRAEDHLERRVLIGRVERHEPLRDRALARLEVPLRDRAARGGSRARSRLNLRELAVRRVVLRARALERVGRAVWSCPMTPVAPRRAWTRSKGPQTPELRPAEPDRSRRERTAPAPAYE